MTAAVLPGDTWALGTGNLVAFVQALFEGFDAVAQSLPERHLAQVGGTCFDVRTALPDYAATVRRGLAHHPAQPATATCQVLIVCGQQQGWPRMPHWAEPYYREREVEATLATTRYRVHYLHDLGFWQFHDRETGRGIQWMRDAASLPAWDGGSPLRNFMHWHFASRGRGLVHAGSLVLGERALLLAGPGGSGKSGTVLAGIGHGLRTAGDDYVLVSPGPDITVQALFNTLKQDPAGFERLGLGRHLGAAPTINWQGKHQFTLDDLGMAPVQQAVSVKALCLPTVTGQARTRFERVGHKEAFLALAPSGVSQMPGDRDTTFAFCANLARQLPAWRMHLGTDPHEITDAVVNFLTQPS